MEQPLEQRLAAYIQSRLVDARRVAVSQLSRIAGGSSRETSRFLLSYDEDGEHHERHLILRRDLPSSLLESERRVEFAAYRAFRDTAIPVPEMLWLEEDARFLDRPFFIAEEITGCQSDARMLQCDPYLGMRREIGRAKWRILGSIARLDPDTLGYFELFERPEPQDIWHMQLAVWEQVLLEDAMRPEPIIAAAIRWLKRHPPPPPPNLAIVHGDFRTGNFLFDKDGKIQALLDWEMTHVGDPLEDLGWSLARIWCFGQRDLRGALLPREEAIAAWEEGSGRPADRDALHWWELFAAVKGQALWVSAGHNARHGVSAELIHFGTAWCMTNGQDRAALELMGRL